MIEKIPISVIISVKNEELNLPKCLENLSEFDEVLVVDSESTDSTVNIANDWGAETISFKWNGQFPKKRNWALANLIIKNEWVLFLDADEFVTIDFVNEVKSKISNDSFNGYTLEFDNYFMGSKLNYGYPFKKNALFKKSKGKYEKIDEVSWSNLDMEVHEHPIIKGKIGKIKSRITHKDFRNLEHYISKHNEYSSWEAHRYIHLKKQKSQNLSINQKIKYSLLNSGILPIIYFIGVYVFKLGFLDGKEGYMLAKYKAHYFFQIRSKIIEIKQAQ